MRVSVQSESTPRHPRKYMPLLLAVVWLALGGGILAVCTYDIVPLADGIRMAGFYGWPVIGPFIFLVVYYRCLAKFLQGETLAPKGMNSMPLWRSLWRLQHLGIFLAFLALALVYDGSNAVCMALAGAICTVVVLLPGALLTLRRPRAGNLLTKGAWLLVLIVFFKLRFIFFGESMQYASIRYLPLWPVGFGHYCANMGIALVLALMSALKSWCGRRYAQHKLVQITRSFT